MLETTVTSIDRVTVINAALRATLHAGQLRACELEAADREAESEARLAHQLLEQARTFQARLEALEYEGQTL